MGVSIRWSIAIKKEHDITPGDRSAAAAVLQEHGWDGIIGKDDVLAMTQIAARQESNGIRKMLMQLVDAIEEHGSIEVNLHW